MKDGAHYITLGGLAVLSVVVALAAHNLSRLDGQLARHMTITPDEEPNMEELTQQVTRTNGDVVTAHLVRNSTETLDQFIARWDAFVAKLKATP